SEPPISALARLCDTFSRRIVYQLKKNRILIARPGVGDHLPEGSIQRDNPSLDVPERPGSIGVLGAETPHQMRLRLVAVGEEWDGSYKPLDLLSYAPLTDKK